MNPIIIQFNPTGPSDIDVQAVCEGWQDSFSIKMSNNGCFLELQEEGLSNIEKDKACMRISIDYEIGREIIHGISLVRVGIDQRDIPEKERTFIYVSRKRVEAKIEQYNFKMYYDKPEDRELLTIFKEREIWIKALSAYKQSRGIKD